MKATPVLLALCLLLTGCATEGTPATTDPAAPTTDAGGAAAQEVAMATTGAYPLNPGFSPAELTLNAGQNVTVHFTNAETNPVITHDWVVEGVEGAASDSVGAGETTDLNFVVPAAGTYSFFCSIGDHRERGMEGTLTAE